MDIKERLRANLKTPSEVICGGDVMYELVHDALAEIERLETSYRSLEGAIGGKQAPLERMADTLDRISVHLNRLSAK